MSNFPNRLTTGRLVSEFSDSVIGTYLKFGYWFLEFIFYSRLNAPALRRNVIS